MISKILITGGTGTLGKALTAELLKTGIEQIRIFSRDEYKQERMSEEFNDKRIRFLLGDIRDRARLVLACRGIDSVVHLAALKVVPWLEFNPMECVKTNVVGTDNVASVCDEAEVERVVFVSSDKAVNPRNIYGHSKAMGEHIILDYNSWSSCSFAVIRFGNLIGSRGSVVEKWNKQKAEGKPITVTDWKMTRYWISPTHAARHILRVLMAHLPGIFIPEMQEITLKDIFHQMNLGGCKVEMIGLREGEKLKEELCLPSEKITHIGGEGCEIKIF